MPRHCETCGRFLSLFQAYYCGRCSLRLALVLGLAWRLVREYLPLNPAAGMGNFQLSGFLVPDAISREKHPN